jgi:DHA1 family multidrug resistance protein-like MFS transporter
VPAAATPEPPSDTPPAQDWRALLAIYGLTSLIEAIGVSQIFAFLPLRLAEIHLPSQDVATFTGLFSSLIFVFGIFLVPFWGVWADKYSRRAVIVRSAIVEAVVFAGVALAAEPWQLAITLLLVGLQLGNTGVMLAALRDVTPHGRVGTVTALFGAMSPIGFAFGPAIGGIMKDGLHLPLTAVFWSSAALSLAIVALLMIGSREVRPEVVPTGRSIDLARRAIVSVLSDAHVRRLFLIFGVAILGNQMTRPFVPILVQRLVGSGEGLTSAIALVVGTAALIGALVSPVSGPIGDRFGLRGVLVGALVLGGVSAGLMPAAPSLLSLAGLAVVYAAAYAAVQAMVFSLLATEVAPERRSTTLNLVLLPLYFAGIVGPSVAAGVSAVAGVASIYPAAGAVMVVGALVIAGVVRRPRRRAAGR